ncbi:MAG: O-methyltransferase [Nitrobacter sp.]|uniref:methyltransferase n=1 Tax=Nitrobacter sp. TaxID=29420 RepID=UPI00387DEC4D
MTAGDGLPGDDMPIVRGISERWRGLRDTLLSSRRFQRWAAAFPLTRPVARRHAVALFDLCAGFVYSQVLAACVQLDLFSLLQHGPQPAATLAARFSIPVQAMTALLEAAASLRLLERRGERGFGLGPLGAALLGNPGVAAMVAHHAALYADLADPVALLSGTSGERRLSRYWPYAAAPSAPELTRAAVAPYTALMAASQPMVAEMVLGAYSFARHRCLLDVGGGDGSFLIAAGRQAPRLELKLFDLPDVAAIAREKFAAASLGDRASVAGGNFLADALPRGADVISLIRVVHDHGDEAVLNLFARVREALPEGGTLVIGEPLAGAPGVDSVGAYFEIYLQAMGSGRPRTFAATRQLLHLAGFRNIRRRPTRIPLIASVVVAQS